MEKINIETVTRICTICKAEKPWSDYGKNRSKKYGIATECKPCAKQIGEQYRARNRKKLAARQRQYHERNKERIANQRKKYRSVNKEKLSEYKKLIVKELRDSYLIQKIVRSDKTLKQAPIPQSLINLKRAEIKLKRLIKDKSC